MPSTRVRWRHAARQFSVYRQRPHPNWSESNDVTEQTWGPTTAGAFIVSGSWQFSLKGSVFHLVRQGTVLEDSVLNLTCFELVLGIGWCSVKLESQRLGMVEVDGMRYLDALDMVRTVVSAKKSAVAEKVEKVAAAREKLSSARMELVEWAESTSEACKLQLRLRGWLTHEFKLAQTSSRPASIAALLKSPGVIEQVPESAPEVQDAVKFWACSFDEFCDGINRRHLEAERAASHDFFARVEKSPLNEEQVAAAACFDSRVLLVASAGSGKTSTMIAKTGYALHKGYFAADKILLLAFNNDAAATLRQRLKDRLLPLGLPFEKVQAKTFHAFGLDIIGAATGARPSLASWLESGRDLESLLQIVDELKGSDPSFRAAWDLFRVVLGQDLPEFGKEADSQDVGDSSSRKGGFRTLNNDVVKSRGEQVIANWLFYNGVPYVYEMEYEHATADAAHRQYRPDFYFPEVGAYLEHWALDERGNPPLEFHGYKEGLEWKKSIHARYGTVLLETTMAELWSGRALSHLASELERLGVVLDPNPDRTVPGQKPILAPRLARTFRTFHAHVKSNRLSMVDLRRKLDSGIAGRFSYRHQLFLDLFERLALRWDERLRSEGCIDFEDMLQMAADHIESGQWVNPYELVMVDEFQDASQARMRILAGMGKKSGTCIFAVGDDWQSINRFAGADISVMTDFCTYLGPSVILKLEQTFRCPQSLCDISGGFVQKNPRQIRKHVRSSQPDVPEPVSIIRLEDARRETSEAVLSRLGELAKASCGKGTSVFLLGRYNNDRNYLPSGFDCSVVDVQFVTVHSSKGLEADHVIVPGLISGVLGFPSEVADDPVLQLAMPNSDGFSDAEERRLFYVALTRARQSVTLITQIGRESNFITELVRDYELKVTDASGATSDVVACPECGLGFMALRKGVYGEFLGCSCYPKCRHTSNIAEQMLERSKLIQRGFTRKSLGRQA